MAENDDRQPTARVRQVTLAAEDGTLHAGWIPAAVADRDGALVNIAGQCFTVMSLYPSVTLPDNRLPVWGSAMPWTEQDEA